MTTENEPSPWQLLTDKWPQKLHLIWLLIVGFFYALLPFSWCSKKSVAGKNVLITGAGSGLGRGVALRLARRNARIIIWDVNEQAAKEAAKEISSVGSYEALVFAVNLADRKAVYETAKRTLDQVGVIDILVNNAGIVAGGNFFNIPDDKKQLVMTVNAICHWWTINAFVPKMIEQRSGHLVTIASQAGLTGCPELTDYTASKFAAVGTHEALNLELNAMGCGSSQNQVHTTLICPSFINTGMFTGVKPSTALVPVLDPEYVCDRITDAILTNTAVLELPRSLYFVNYAKSFMPVNAFIYTCSVLGIYEAMSGFKGRAGVKH